MSHGNTRHRELLQLGTPHTHFCACCEDCDYEYTCVDTACTYADVAIICPECMAESEQEASMLKAVRSRVDELVRAEFSVD